MFSLQPLKVSILFLATLFSSSFVFAENILNLSEGVNLLAINGKEAKSPSFFNDHSAYKLPNGINQIVVSYTAEIKNGSEYELEYTNAFVLLFDQKDEQLLIAAPEIKKIKDIKELEEKGNWILTAKSGQPVDYKVSLIKNNGFQLSRDYERELEDFNKTDAAAALPNKPLFNPNQLTKNNTAKAKNNNTNAKKNMSSQMLIFWYNQADEETRKSFKKLINNH